MRPLTSSARTIVQICLLYFRSRGKFLPSCVFFSTKKNKICAKEDISTVNSLSLRSARPLTRSRMNTIMVRNYPLPSLSYFWPFRRTVFGIAKDCLASANLDRRLKSEILMWELIRRSRSIFLSDMQIHCTLSSPPLRLPLSHQFKSTSTLKIWVDKSFCKTVNGESYISCPSTFYLIPKTWLDVTLATKLNRHRPNCLGMVQ